MLEHNYAQVNGIRLHYVSSGQGKLLLFVHGFPEFWREWKDQLQEFGRDHQAVALDMRGYNLSDKPIEVEQYRMRHLVEDVRALAQHLGHERFTLIGHDWGGAVAWAFAMRYPQHLEKLIVINSPHPAIYMRLMREHAGQQEAARYRLTFEQPHAEQLLEANHYAMLVEFVLKDGLESGYLNEDDRRAYLEAWSQAGALTGGLNWYRAMPLYPKHDDAERERATRLATRAFRVNVPTLVLWAEGDAFFVPECLDGLEEFVPDVRIQRIADGSHWVVHKKVDEINAALREFIEKH